MVKMAILKRLQMDIEEIEPMNVVMRLPLARDDQSKQSKSDWANQLAPQLNN
jgi:hypothetical protein